jgi:hypothetical protein
MRVTRARYCRGTLTAKPAFMNALIKLPERNLQSGKLGYALAWLLGVPLPILLIIYLISRC